VRNNTQETSPDTTLSRLSASKSLFLRAITPIFRVANITRITEQIKTVSGLNPFIRITGVMVKIVPTVPRLYKYTPLFINA